MSIETKIHCDLCNGDMRHSAMFTLLKKCKMPIFFSWHGKIEHSHDYVVCVDCMRAVIKAVKNK
jgi:hypothetical protein